MIICDLWKKSLELDQFCVFRDELHRNPPGFCNILFSLQRHHGTITPFPQEKLLFTHTAGRSSPKTTSQSSLQTPSESREGLKLPLNPNFQWH